MVDSKISLVNRRMGADDIPLDEYFGGKKRFFNPTYETNVVKVFAGDCYITTREDEMVATVLGSCVSACVRDPIAKVGGMNHFLLPGDENSDNKASDAARYGVFAMESLINGLLNAGAQKPRLEFKVFGGGNVINNSARIGTKNANFVRDFLKREGYRITTEDLEGDFPRSVHYYPITGKVMVRKLKRQSDCMVAAEEAKYQQKISIKPIEGDIELF